jgi:hypothetical protein
MFSQEQQRHIQQLAIQLADAAAQSGPSHKAHVNIHEKTTALVMKIGSLALGSPFNKTYMHSIGITDSLLSLLPPRRPPPASPLLDTPPSFFNAVCRTLK